MKKILIASLILVGCNSAPEGFCDCLEQGEKLNKITNEVLSGDLSNAKKETLLKTRRQKEKVCAPFVNAKGDQMREWKKSCEN